MERTHLPVRSHLFASKSVLRYLFFALLSLDVESIKVHWEHDQTIDGQRDGHGK